MNTAFSSFHKGTNHHGYCPDVFLHQHSSQDSRLAWHDVIRYVSVESLDRGVNLTFSCQMSALFCAVQTLLRTKNWRSCPLWRVYKPLQAFQESVTNNIHRHSFLFRSLRLKSFPLQQKQPISDLPRGDNFPMGKTFQGSVWGWFGT